MILERKALLAGRTLWLGGTETAKAREISMINCSATEIRNVNDVVDAFWLLLNGCGVGFKPYVGTLNGFKKPIKDIQVIRTQRGKSDKGRETNLETFVDGTWTISLGDSGEAWAKSIGKLLSGKYDAHTLVFDFSEVRGSGGRLKGYGWISSGDDVVSEIYPKIARLLSAKAGQLLDEIDILDILNYLGVIQTGRRGAEIAFIDYGSTNWERFATAKKDFWLHDNHHRTQSNNSLLFHSKPVVAELESLFDLMLASGGSEPGIINAKELRRRAPYASMTNPCVTGDTLILTSEGSVSIRDRAGLPTVIWNGEEWSLVTPFCTGLNEIISVEVYDAVYDEKRVIRCTPYHKWLVMDRNGNEIRVEARHLSTGDELSCRYDHPRSPSLDQGLDSRLIGMGEITKIEIEYERELTYCFNEPMAHRGTFNGIVTGQCAEILLPDAGICNLCTLNIAAFESIVEAQRAYYIIARANYRQTLMNLDDGILQVKWHQTNQFLRLCGVSMMGVLQKNLSDYDIKVLKNAAITGATSMAFELGTELPKNITTQKPEGTAAKIAGCLEGGHRPGGRYIFNNITFSKHEPIVDKLHLAGYTVFDNPSQPDGVVVTFPVEWSTVDGFTLVNGTEVNLEPAVEQLDRYLTFMREWTEQNSSITVSYDPSEVPSIIEWLTENWDDYVGVSFLLRTDPTKSAADLGYQYLPQEVVSKEKYTEYVASLKPLTLEDLRETGGIEDVDFLDSCENGVCPVR